MSGYDISGMIGIFVLFANLVYLVWQLARDASRS
jgi:hypothetical protein